MIKKICCKLFPLSVVKTLSNYQILSARLGQYKSMCKERCTDGYCKPIPWYSYPAIEYIQQLDFNDKRIFEYGSGSSTLFWAKRCKRLTSIEDNQEWYNRTKVALSDNVEYRLIVNKESYVTAIRDYPDFFDIIIVDGNYRHACAMEAIKKLQNDGIIILDNSDWFPKTSELLRTSGLIEVDMSGFGPINGYTWTTSFYFSRNVNLKPAHDRQPMPGVGSLDDTSAEMSEMGNV